MMHKFLLAAALAAVPGLAAAQALPSPRYVAKAGASDQYEIQSSRLVLATTRNPELRRFANQMIRHHSKSTQDVTRAAARAGVRAGRPRLDAMGARNVAELRRTRGAAARDALYLQQQRTSHEDALALHSDYARDGRSPPLRRAAATIVPVVQMHIDELRRM